MLRSFTQAIRLLAFAVLALLSASAGAQVTTHTGTLDDGATFLIEVPVNWNGTLFLYSHGYVVPGSANPAQDVGDPATRAFMLANGYLPTPLPDGPSTRLFPTRLRFSIILTRWLPIPSARLPGGILSAA